MEGHFHTTNKAGLVIIGQPDMKKRELDNPIKIPNLLTVMTHGRWVGEVKGLVDFPNDQWPNNVPLLYYAYHIMVGLGTLFIAVMGWSAVQLWRGRLWHSRGLLWVLMLALPFPFISNTAGWLTAELGRQPWLIYGIYRTADGFSEQVSHGNVMFTLLGFMGMYALLSVLYFFVTTRIIAVGPRPLGS
jgi:cytochrome d ubiquinol oxidase subunit I